MTQIFNTNGEFNDNQQSTAGQKAMNRDRNVGRTHRSNQSKNPTITNLTGLQTLLLGEDNFHDYSLFVTLANLPLTEVNLYDQNYVDNPICNFPN
jgi:hypothetical protein